VTHRLADGGGGVVGLEGGEDVFHGHAGVCRGGVWALEQRDELALQRLAAVRRVARRRAAAVCPHVVAASCGRLRVRPPAEVLTSLFSRDMAV
jgi:hypothetical protein